MTDPRRTTPEPPQGPRLPVPEPPPRLHALPERPPGLPVPEPPPRLHALPERPPGLPVPEPTPRLHAFPEPTPGPAADPERALDPFLDAALTDAERAASRPPPPFAAVLARAHSLAPASVPPPAAAPVLTALPSGPVSKNMLDETVDPHAADLAPFLAAARTCADLDIAARLRRPLPPLPRPPLASPPRPRVFPLILAAAAALLLAVLGAPGLRSLAEPAFRTLTGAQADASLRDGPPEHHSTARVPAPTSRRPASDERSFESSIPDGPPPALAPHAVDASEHVPGDISPPLAGHPTQPLETPPAEPATAAPSLTPDRPAAHKSIRTGPSGQQAHDPRPAGDPVAAELARLDDEAEALLLAGALDEADARYRKMIAIGGRRSAVEHAYADRWLLARRTGDEARQRELLRAYLARFPRGRFADEATAGLCRLAAPSERPACWRDYRDRFPGGAYRREADEAAGP